MPPFIQPDVHAFSNSEESGELELSRACDNLKCGGMTEISDPQWPYEESVTQAREGTPPTTWHQTHQGDWAQQPGSTPGERLRCDTPPLGAQDYTPSSPDGLNVSFSEGTQAGSLGRRCCHLSGMSPRQGKESRLPCPRGHSGFNMLLSPETGFLLKFLLTNRGYTDTVIMKTNVGYFQCK